MYYTSACCYNALKTSLETKKNILRISLARQLFIQSPKTRSTDKKLLWSDFYIKCFLFLLFGSITFVCIAILYARIRTISSQYSLEQQLTNRQTCQLKRIAPCSLIIGANSSIGGNAGLTALVNFQIKQISGNFLEQFNFQASR